jgi:2-phosphoglycerate kinase
MTIPDLKQSLSHVLWIGGATDSGKTTLARMLAEKHSLQVYHYDREDARQVTALAQTIEYYRAFLAATLDERWVQPEPEELYRFVLRGFQDRFPLVLEDLLALPREPGILAEGFGLTPDLVAPLLTSRRQAIWLVPTDAFKRASMQRRGKPSFRKQVSDPERAARNLFERDRMITGYVQESARQHDLELVEVDDSASLEEMAVRIEQHFGLIA